MPALNPNNTARAWFKYVTGAGASSQEHEVMWRYNPDVASLDNVCAYFKGLLDAIGPAGFRTGWKVLAGRYSAAGSDFSLPFQPTASLLSFLGTNVDASYTASWEAVEDVYVGRSLTSGRRAEFSLYRAKGQVDSTFRFGMPAGQISALSFASGAGCLLCIDGVAPAWYTYVNQNYNSHWERELRS